jgi:hypothetical protein
MLLLQAFLGEEGHKTPYVRFTPRSADNFCRHTARGGRTMGELACSTLDPKSSKTGFRSLVLAILFL